MSTNHQVTSLGSAKPKYRKVEYVIFDMDGLLIDTERVYTQVTNEILGRYGKKMTWDVKAGLMGKPERDAAAYLLSFFPDISLTVDEYLVERNMGHQRLWPSVRLLPGAQRLVEHLQAHGVPFALATSSKRLQYVRKTAHLQALFACFGNRVVCSDDCVMRGKPAPDIFLIAAREKLGLSVGDAEGVCTEAERMVRANGLVFEDAIPGFQAAKRAGMSVVWVPDANLLGVEYSGDEKPDLTITSLEQFVPEDWSLPPYS